MRIGPGSIMTDMLASVNSDPAARNRILSRTPLGRIGEPSEIAAIAAFLASDDASYITGQTIYADGGRLPLNYTVPVKAAEVGKSAVPPIRGHADMLLTDCCQEGCAIVSPSNKEDPS